MRIHRLELKNFRTFAQAVFEDIPNLVVLVSPNGLGKSSILEAIIGAHDLVSPYHQDNYQFQKAWQQRHVPVWPPHLPEPVKIGERRAEVWLEVEASGREKDYLRESQINATIGKANFVIEDGRHITSMQADETIKRLCRFHSLGQGVGFIDYIRAIRYYRTRPLGNFASDLADEQVRQSFSEFHRPCEQHEKFGALKSFVVSSQLDDFSHFQATGDKTDSLGVFRQVFDHFFSPKRFIGYRTPAGGNAPEVVVESPFGPHSIDALSDGEKEVLHIFAHLYRFRGLENTVLWDTPELHLNAALESRLYHALNQIAPTNQYWIASHSLEFINSVPLENIFVIRSDGTGAQIERSGGDERRTRVAIYRDLGAQVGLQLVSSVVAFVEGKDSNSDKSILDRLVAPTYPGVNFVAGGSCESLLSTGTRANRLLSEACTNGDFLAIVDRDYRSNEAVAETVAAYKGRLFIWNVHEIENVFLAPEVVLAVLQFLGLVSPTDKVEAVRNGLKHSAESLREWIAADWVAWDFDKAFQPPARRIAGDDPKSSLLNYTAALQAKITAATDLGSVESRYQEKLSAIDRFLASDEWLVRLPGKQLLHKYLESFPKLGVDTYVRAAIGLALEKKIVLSEIERLKQFLREIQPGVGR